MNNIYEVIHTREQEFKTIPVRVVEGYDFNQSETLRRINLYANGQFLDGNDDELGEKIFFDITTPAVRNAAKNIDLDTKDIRFSAVNGEANFFKSWLYRRKAKDWMRETGVARKLNEIPEKVSGVGTVVVKRVATKSVFELVDLRNLACDASAKRLNDGWTSERHYYTPNELRAQIERGWNADAIEEAIANFVTHRQENYVGSEDSASTKKGNAQYICAHEFYGYIEESLLMDEDDTDNTNLVLANFIVILPAISKKSSEGKAVLDGEGLTLFKSKIKEMPYKELHYRKVDGRWMGRGLYEDCFPMQETENTRSNQLLLAMRLSQLIVFQTREKTVLQNVLTDLTNGHILKFAEGKGDMLSRVDTSSKDNGSNNLMGNNVQNVMRGLTNAYEVTTGESLPSGTPFSLGALMNQNANKLFEFIREDYGIFLQEIFNDWVLPELEKELTLKGILEIVDKDELEYVRKHFVNWRVWDTIKRTILSGMKPTIDQINIAIKFVTDQLNKQDSLFIEIPEGFLSYKKSVIVTVTDESESPAMMQSLSTILQIVSQNPAVLDSPVFSRILDSIGLSRVDVEPRGSPGAQPPQPQAQPA